MVLLFKWHTMQIDYILTFLQAPVEHDNIYMKILQGFKVQDGSNPEEWVLHLKKNVYGMVQASRVWNKYLVSKLQKAGFKQSKMDECLFFRGSCIYILYTDDSILAAPTKQETEAAIAAIQEQGLEITIEGDIGDFLGVKIERNKDGSYSLTQPQLIDSILQDLNLQGDNVTTKNMPSAKSKLLRRFTDSPAFDNHFHYRSVIGKLNFLEKSTRSDIAYAVHQCARFSSDPRKPHGDAVTWTGRYLKSTKDQGLVLRPTKQSFEVYADSDFAGAWNKEDAPDDPDTARSRTGYVIFYAGCPIVWKSKMQTTIALSTTEAELLSMSEALREAIYLMNLIKEIRDQGFNLTALTPTIHCQTFEDNAGAIETVKVPKFRPRTKHMNTSWHHFGHHVERGDISVHKIDSEDNCADTLTKAQPLDLFLKHRKVIQGW